MNKVISHKYSELLSASHRNKTHMVTLFWKQERTDAQSPVILKYG